MSKYCPFRVHAHQTRGMAVTGGNITEQVADEHCACLEERCALWGVGKCSLVLQDTISAKAALLADEITSLTTVLAERLNWLFNAVNRIS
jgi:hypothetical protein